MYVNNAPRILSGTGAAPPRIDSALVSTGTVVGAMLSALDSGQRRMLLVGPSGWASACRTACCPLRCQVQHTLRAEHGALILVDWPSAIRRHHERRRNGWRRGHSVPPTCPPRHRHSWGDRRDRQPDKKKRGLVVRVSLTPSPERHTLSLSQVTCRTCPRQRVTSHPARSGPTCNPRPRRWGAPFPREVWTDHPVWGLGFGRLAP